ncbi:hypothetical protein FHR99_002620 [Litorivivens lipolytica]|uniref:DUF2889 domain-containing protein n=1 Tax=Litorivivens lipolytica TaxID=1524264 RepID=A0A7W4Z7X3_9GAMM|nr:DUF2889 domain-containing protein [Litorivivens lipolytica]MBB3048346.1 hypothetical protein [Litorivivens lipolytica]
MSENTYTNVDREFAINPNYGKGCFRRQILLRNEPGQVVAALEDDCHGFRVTLRHDGTLITDVQGETLRVPYTTCPGATEPLRALRGVAVGSDARSINSQVSPFSNCTHLFDLSVLAIVHAGRRETERLYEVQVDDEVDGQPAQSVVWCNGEEMLRFTTQEWQIVGPECYAGRPLFKGFAAWANETFSGDLCEAAFVLHKGYFVSSARRYDASAMAGTRGDELPYIPGACHTYSEGRVQQAIRLPDTNRDFTDRPEDLLQFKSA